MNGLLSDCRHAVRLYARTPGASLIAVVILAIGMSFVGAFLSLYADLSLKPFPGIEDSERLVSIAEVNGENSYALPFGLTERMADQVTALVAAVGVGERRNMPVGSGSDRVNLEYASRGFFDGLRPQLAVGRGFEPMEHDIGAEPVAVISNRFWREQYAGRRDVVGSDIDLWVPFERFLPFLAGTDANYAQARSEQYLRTIGRLRPGVSAEALVRELEARFPEEAIQGGPGTRFAAEPGVVRSIPAQRETERQLQLFLAGSVLLALVAAANVSLFLLARAPGRHRELAIRVSVGARVKRLARQLVTESGLLVVASGILGLLLSIWLANFLRGMAFLRLAEWQDVTLLDWRVLSLVGVFLLILAMLVSLAPILGLRRSGLAASGRRVAARATLAQQIAGTAQIAIAVAFGGAALAFVWFLVQLSFGNPGYEMEDRHVATLVPPFFPGPSAGQTSARIDTDRQREIIEALPSVGLVAFTDQVPGGQAGGLLQQPILDPVDPSREILVGQVRIDARFVDVLGLQLLYGRSPTESELGVALVNRSLARSVFGRENVVGETLVSAGAPEAGTEIVGVLEDLSFGHPAAAVLPAFFTKARSQAPAFRAVIQSALPSNELQQELQALYDSGRLDRQPMGVMPLAEFRDRDIAPDRARGLLTILTAVLVVLIAAFGFYGTQRYLVSAGRREYAVRAAIGAGPRALGRLVFRRGLILGLPGLVLGGLLALILVAWLRDAYLSREISSVLVSFCVVAGLTLLLLAASAGPSRQAMRTQPAPLLRED